MTKGQYVDGFVLSIPKKNTARYKKMAREACEVWKKFGALDYKECIINDPKPKSVTFTFFKMAKPKPGEVVWFSFIVYKSRKHRDVVNKKVMSYFDKKYSKDDIKMPFDMKRFAYGGFKVEVGM
ncbi:MAG: hypothetical protein A3D50_00105 [Candidatus Taylorbacteria bacterium RIFCSPHIGHO2_02_FULL_44_12]|uniref:RNA signal recognition particle n=1 Tax=Candidatus Taylorbacteria bacterium RIFCSPHIGHO2_02_FULL_44_12 TaxID=1802308 RepID=A0A1G2MKD7_9BACT|nr:MAG: hypothetical protein A3D50_00105 [Candidatus Taylorbacteria bacterium RIFCSPHIGHO2_02_FULL_44_12]